MHHFVLFEVHIAIIMFYCSTQPDYQWYAPDQFPPDVQHKTNGKTTAGWSILSCLHFYGIFWGGCLLQRVLHHTLGGMTYSNMNWRHSTNVMHLGFYCLPLHKENARRQKCMDLSSDFCSNSCLKVNILSGV